MKILLLAPIGVSGGISTWAKVFRESAPDDLKISILDTSLRFRVLGTRALWRRAILGSVNAASRFIAVIRRLRADPEIDAVYLTCSPSAGFWIRDLPLVILLSSARTPVIVHLHGGNEAMYFGKRRLARAWSRYSLGRADAIITIARSIELAAHEFLRPDSKIYNVPNMIQPSSTALSRPIRGKVMRRVLQVGWQGREKGTYEILRVAANLPEYEFALVGPIAPDIRPLIEAELSALNHPSNVRFLGELRGAALQEQFDEADLFLFPSHSEGFPMAVLEAMTRGLPVIATDVGAVPEILAPPDRPPAGIVVPLRSEDVVAILTEAVRQLAKDADLRRRLGVNGSNIAKELYSPAVVMPQLMAILSSVAVE